MQYTIVGCLLHLGLAGLEVEGGETISRSSMLKDRNVVVVAQVVMLVKMHQTIIKGFPGGAVVQSPPADAGENGFMPRSGKIPHDAERLGP